MAGDTDTAAEVPAAAAVGAADGGDAAAAPGVTSPRRHLPSSLRAKWRKAAANVHAGKLDEVPRQLPPQGSGDPMLRAMLKNEMQAHDMTKSDMAQVKWSCMMKVVHCNRKNEALKQEMKDILENRKQMVEKEEHLRVKSELDQALVREQHLEKTLVDTVEKWKGKVHEKWEQLRKAEEVRDAAVKEAKEEKEQAGALRAELSEERERREAAETTVAALRRQVDELSGEKKQLKEDLRWTEEQVADLRDELAKSSKLRDRLEWMTAERDEAAKEAARGQRTIAELDEASARAADDAEGMLMLLLTRVSASTLRPLCPPQRSRSDRLNQLFDACRSAPTPRRADDIAGVAGGISRLGSLLSDRLDGLCSVIMYLQEELNRVAAEKERAVEERMKAVEERQEALDQRFEAEERCRNADQRIAELTKRIAEAEEALRAAEAARRAAEDAARAEQERAAKLLARVEELDAKLKGAHGAMEAEVTEMRGKISALQSELAQLRKERDRLVAAQEALKIQYREEGFQTTMQDLNKRALAAGLDKDEKEQVASLLAELRELSQESVNAAWKAIATRLTLRRMQAKRNPRICRCHHCGAGPYEEFCDTECGQCGETLVYEESYIRKWRAQLMQWIKKRNWVIWRQNAVASKITTILDRAEERQQQRKSARGGCVYEQRIAEPTDRWGENRRRNEARARACIRAPAAAAEAAVALPPPAGPGTLSQHQLAGPFGEQARTPALPTMVHWAPSPGSPAAAEQPLQQLRPGAPGSTGPTGPTPGPRPVTAPLPSSTSPRTGPPQAAAFSQLATGKLGSLVDLPIPMRSGLPTATGDVNLSRLGPGQVVALAPARFGAALAPASPPAAGRRLPPRRVLGVAAEAHAPRPRS